MKPLVQFDTTADTPLACRMADLPDTEARTIMYMPGGRQTITPVGGGIGRPITVVVDAAGAAAVEAQRQALAAKGRKPYFDAEHADEFATFWPEKFEWRESPKPGIYATGELTSEGKAGIAGKKWRVFSPVFHVDDKTAAAARIVCNPAASPNMGAFCNNAAFSNISPLWAKHAVGAQSNIQDKSNMQDNDTAALRAKIEEQQTTIARLEADVTSIKAKGENAELVQARLDATKNELKANQATLELEEIKAKNTVLENADKARREADADKAVAEAVARGAIAAKDEEGKQQWKTLLAANPANAALLAKAPGNPALGERLTPNANSVKVTAESPKNIIYGFGRIVAKNAALRGPGKHAEKGALAREAAAIYAADIADNPAMLGLDLGAIFAADNPADIGDLGTLSGTLVLQRALPLLMYEYPVLRGLSTDFSDTPGLYGQTEKSRIVITPAVQTYDPTAGTDGRPAGWSTAQPAQTVDVPITLDEYVGVPIVFDAQTIGSTVRNLFGEAAPKAVYALGGHFVNKATALMTAANFCAYAAKTFTGGATTSGSKEITVTATTGMYVGMPVTGSGIPAGSFIVSVTNSTTALLNKKATASASGLTFTGNSAKVPTVYASYAKALADFNMASLDDIAGAFDINEVPQQDRLVLLNAAYYRRLRNDPQLNMFFAAQQSPEIITKGRLPELTGFAPYNAPYFPTSNYRVGFAAHKAAVLLKSRVPNDLTGNASVGANFPGSITTVTDPGTGLTMLLVQYINPTGGYAEWRIEAMLGAAVGDPRCGMVITSQ